MTACNRKGSVVVDVVIAAAMIIFVVLPVFSAVIEKYILMEKARVIRDAVDMTNISAYNGIKTGSLGQASVKFERSEVNEIFRELLCTNLALDRGMYPKYGSIAEGRVEVSSLEIYTDVFPVVCPEGSAIVKPSVHSSINVPVKPSLYRGLVLRLLGKDHIDVEVHVDSEIPVNR